MSSSDMYPDIEKRNRGFLGPDSSALNSQDRQVSLPLLHPVGNLNASINTPPPNNRIDASCVTSLTSTPGIFGFGVWQPPASSLIRK